MLYIPATRKRPDKLIHGRRGRTGACAKFPHLVTSRPYLHRHHSPPYSTLSPLPLSAQGGAPRLAPAIQLPCHLTPSARHISPPVASFSPLTSLRRTVGGAASSPHISSTGRTSSSREQQMGDSTATHGCTSPLPVAQQQQGAGPSGTSLLSLCCSSRRAGSKEQVWLAVFFVLDMACCFFFAI